MSSVREPEWDDEQLDLVIAEQIIQGLTGKHGEWLPEATSEDADPMNYSGWRYITEGPYTNWAEKEHADAMDALKKQYGETANLNGKYYTVKRFDYLKSSENDGQ